MTTSLDSRQDDTRGGPQEAPPRRPSRLLAAALVASAVFGTAVAFAILLPGGQRGPVTVAALPPPLPAAPAPPQAETPPAEPPTAEPPAAEPPAAESRAAEAAPAEAPQAGHAPAEVPRDGSLPSPVTGIEETVPAPPAEPPAAATGQGPAAHGETPHAHGQPQPGAAAEAQAPAADGPKADATAPETAPALPPAALAAAPDPGLVEQGRDGALPIIGSDGRQPWRVYARPFADTTTRPRIAIVVAGLGLRESTSQDAIAKLPPDVTLSFTPYARNLEDWVARARGAGHEILMQVPMEPVDFPTSDPGPKALMTTLSPGDNRVRLEWTLARAPGYVGVMTYMGSRFTSNAEAMQATAEILKARGLMILDSHTSDQSAVAAVAARLGLPRAVATRFIDATPTRAAVDARLAELERFARQNGYAIGIAADYPGSIERIAAWAAGLDARGLVLAPISALADTTTTE